MAERTMLTVQEVADMKGVDARTVRGWIGRALLQAEQINPRLWLIPAAAAEKFQPPPMGRRPKPKQQAARAPSRRRKAA